ncbi:MAG: hypothetical protein H6838_12070 [Planctomycetes bacterium]|nr:hypothetical protein [Planctomycetota bacterium]MCB9886224.1 hypothetical protein [Planctomycetota bacterium]
MHAATRHTILPPIPPALRFALSGCLLAGILYLGLFWEPGTDSTHRQPATPEIVVPVPRLDLALLATVHDATREQRILLETEPYKHLLTVAMDVVPSVADALGMPDEPVPLAEVQAHPDQWRSHWLWYEGRIEDLTGPRQGHPIKGRSIYEATLRLADGGHVIAAFTLPPPEGLHKGSWARVEGYLLKLRDTNYPFEVKSAPMLIGRAIQPDYEDWGPVTELDPRIMAQIVDNNFWPGSPAWRSVDEDQGEPLWHLAAYARDTAKDRTLEDWRKFGTLNAAETHPLLMRNQIAHGAPLRLLGTLIRRQTIAAPANPAGIRHWTVAWVQVRDYGGHVIPVWVPKRVADLPERCDLEVRAYYYRWYVYETQDDTRLHVPLFIAADLDPYKLEVDGAARWLTGLLGTFVTGLIILFWWIQHRWAKSSIEHQRHLDMRRRQRREREAAASSSAPSSP